MALYQTASAGAPTGTQTRPTSVPGNVALSVVAPLYVANADGSVTFTFPTTAPALPTLAAGFPLGATAGAQTMVGIQASRIYDGVSYPAGASFQFIAGGVGTAVPRTVVSDAACNACHGNMQAHGSRRTVNLCLTCHTPGWIQNPTANNTANAIDFRVMVHQIHVGQTMPNLAAPWVYKWSATTDFSNVMFAPPNSVKNCTQCHNGGAQSSFYKDNPTQAACASCHVSHPGTTGAFPPDDECILCHKPDVDSLAPSTAKVHSPLYNGTTNTTFVGKTIDITIDSVNVTTQTAATVTFTVKVDGVAADIKATPLTSLRFTYAGPATDYGADVAGAFRSTGTTTRAATPSPPPSAGRPARRSSPPPARLVSSAEPSGTSRPSTASRWASASRRTSSRPAPARSPPAPRRSGRRLRRRCGTSGSGPAPRRPAAT